MAQESGSPEAGTATLAKSWYDGVTWGPLRPIFYTVQTMWWEGFDEYLNALRELDDAVFQCAPGWAGIFAALRKIFDKHGIPTPPISRSAFLALGRDFERRSAQFHQWHEINPQSFCQFFCSTLYRLAAGLVQPVAIAPLVYIPGDSDVVDSWHVQYSRDVPQIQQKLKGNWSSQFHFTAQSWNEEGVARFINKVFLHLGLSLPTIPYCILYQLFREVDAGATHILTPDESKLLAQTILNRTCQLQSIPEVRRRSPAPTHVSRASEWFPAPLDDSSPVTILDYAGIPEDVSLCATREAVNTPNTPPHRATEQAINTPSRFRELDFDVRIPLPNSVAGEKIDLEVDEDAPTRRTVPSVAWSADTIPARTLVHESARNTKEVQLDASHYPNPNPQPNYVVDSEKLRAVDQVAFLEQELREMQRRSVETSSELRATIWSQETAHTSELQRTKQRYGELEQVTHDRLFQLEKELLQTQCRISDESSELRAISVVVAPKYRAVVDAGAPSASIVENTSPMDKPVPFTGVRLDHQLATVLASLEADVLRANEARSTVAGLQVETEKQMADRVAAVEHEAQQEAVAFRESCQQEMAELRAKDAERWEREKAELRQEASALKADLQQAESSDSAKAAAHIGVEATLQTKVTTLLEQVREQQEALAIQGEQLQRKVREAAQAKEENVEMGRRASAVSLKLKETEHELALVQIENSYARGRSVEYPTRKESDAQAAASNIATATRISIPKEEEVGSTHLDDGIERSSANDRCIHVVSADVETKNSGQLRDASMIHVTDDSRSKAELQEITAELQCERKMLNKILAERECEEAREKTRDQILDEELRLARADRERVLEEFRISKEAWNEARREEKQRRSHDNDALEDMKSALAQEKARRAELERKLTTNDDAVVETDNAPDGDFGQMAQTISENELPDGSYFQTEAKRWRECAQELGEALKHAKADILSNTELFRTGSVCKGQLEEDLKNAAEREDILSSRASAERDRNIVLTRQTQRLEEKLRTSEDETSKTSKALRIASRDTEFVMKELRELKQKLAEEKCNRSDRIWEVPEAPQNVAAADLKTPRRSTMHTSLSPNPQRRTMRTSLSPNPQRSTMRTSLSPNPQRSTIRASLSPNPQRSTIRASLSPNRQPRMTRPRFNPTRPSSKNVPQQRIRRVESEKLLAAKPKVQPNDRILRKKSSEPQYLQNRSVPITPMNNKAMFNRLDTLERWIEKMRTNASTRSHSGSRKKSVSPNFQSLSRYHCECFR